MTKVKCEICSKMISKNGLATHKRRHKGEKPYSCSVCKKKFYRKGELKVHERVHTGKRPYQCSVYL